MSEHALEIIIIGAGSTGLLLGQGLKQHGIPCTIYERQTPTTYTTRPREWGMTLHWGGDFIKQCIPEHLRSRMNEAIACDPYFNGQTNGLPLYNNATGEQIGLMPGAEPRRVSRRKLREFLKGDLDVRYDKALSNISISSDNRVTATFTDSSTASATLIVGCDGAHSITRSLILPGPQSQTEDIPYHSFNVSCTFPAELALKLRSLDPIFTVSYNPRNFMWWYSIQDIPSADAPPETWVFQNLFSWRGSPTPADFPTQESRIKYWTSFGECVAEPWKSIANALPTSLEHISFPCDTANLWTPKPWNDSPLSPYVTLAGDAAHPFPPFRGQGLNNALEDSARLVKLLVEVKEAKKSLKQAVEEYEEEMIRRAQQEIPVSMKQMEVTHDFEQFMLKMGPMFKFGMGKGTQDDGQSKPQTAQEKIEAVQAEVSGGGASVDGR